MQSCLWECTVGNVKMQDTPVEALVDMVSDRGSTPLASTKMKSITIRRCFFILHRIGRGVEPSGLERKGNVLNARF